MCLVVYKQQAEYEKWDSHVHRWLDMPAKDLIKEIDLKDPVPNEIVVHEDVAESYMSMSMYLSHQ